MGADRPKSLMFCVHVFLSIQSLSGVAGIVHDCWEPFAPAFKYMFFGVHMQETNDRAPPICPCKQTNLKAEVPSMALPIVLDVNIVG